jgi:hypothetical protein
MACPSLRYNRFLGLIAFCLFLAACASQAELAAVVTATAAQPTASLESSSPPTMPAPTTAPTSTATPISIDTPTTIPTVTPTPSLTPTVTAIPFPCPTPRFMLHLFDRAGALPLDVSMDRAHFADDGDIFIAVENWVGLVILSEPFDVADPRAINVAGFVQWPDLPTISDIAARDNLVFLAAGSQLVVANAAHACWLTPLATAEFSFPVQDIELEGNRLYVGGIADDQLHLEVLNLDVLPAIERLDSLTLPPAIWSVVGEQLLTYDRQSGVVTVTDVSNGGAAQTSDVPLPLDPAWRFFGPPQLVDNTLSLLVIDKGLGSIIGLLESEPTAHWREVPIEFAIEGHMAQVDRIFIFSNWGDAGSNSSTVWTGARDEQDPLREISLYPHYPVHHYYAISDSVIFAFSDYSLIVIDLTAPEGQEIVRTYPLRGRLD